MDFMFTAAVRQKLCLTEPKSHNTDTIAQIPITQLANWPTLLGNDFNNVLIQSDT